jgi:tripartite ATP-independent transporter DctM subunit
MIIYGVTTETSITGLFLGGYIPGLLLGIAFMILLYLVARRRNYGSIAEFRPANVWVEFKRSFLSLLTPIIVVGGILLGVMTPTESGVVGLAYVLVLGFFVHRELKIADLFPAILDAAVLTGVIMFVVGASGVLAWVLASERIPSALVQLMLSLSENKYVILFMINVLLLILGALVDTVALLVIVVPVIHPIGVSLGLDPIHFGVMVVFNLAIGLLTPPIGYCIFVASAIAKAPFNETSLRILPFVAVAVVVLMLVTYVNATTMLLPQLFMR